MLLCEAPLFSDLLFSVTREAVCIVLRTCHEDIAGERSHTHSSSDPQQTHNLLFSPFFPLSSSLFPSSSLPSPHFSLPSPSSSFSAFPSFSLSFSFLPFPSPLLFPIPNPGTFSSMVGRGEGVLEVSTKLFSRLCHFLCKSYESWALECREPRKSEASTLQLWSRLAVVQVCAEGNGHLLCCLLSKGSLCGTSLPQSKHGMGLSAGYQTVKFKKKGFQCRWQSGSTLLHYTLRIVLRHRKITVYHLVWQWISHKNLLSPEFLISKVGVL